jgi:hypothetical protein
MHSGKKPLVEIICGGVFEISADELELSCREEYEECALRIWLMEECTAIRCHQQTTLGPLPDLEQAMRKSVLTIHTEDAPKPERTFVGLIGDEPNKDAAARGERRVREGAPVIKVEVTRVEEAYAA